MERERYQMNFCPDIPVTHCPCPNRFSLLLLEPGEVYFEDFSVNLLKPVIADETRRVGRLKLCSKSLVYDPRDVSQPIVKMPFKECRDISIPPVSLQMRETNVLTIRFLRGFLFKPPISS